MYNKGKIILITLTVIAIIAAVVVLAIYLTKNKRNRKNSGGDNSGGDNSGGDNSGGDNSGGDNSGGDNSGGDNSGGDNSGGSSKMPSGSIKAAWSSLIGCGENEFDIISLASALPGKYAVSFEEFFTSTIVGSYDKRLSSRSKTKYIISIGGSNASPTGWTSFINKLLETNGTSDFINACKCRGVVGIDWDLEGTTAEMVPKILDINRKLKSHDKKFIIVLTILLGSTNTFAPLIPEHDTYDYVALMLYNGGMYSANGTGAGCDWDGWAELICSKGTAGCGSPLGLTREEYSKMANLSSIMPNKVLLGLIIDTAGPRLDSKIQKRAEEIIKKYKAGGVFIWVLPGWVQKDNINKLKELGYNKLNDCNTTESCPQAEKPCVHGKDCVATACGKSRQGVKDEDCAPCATGQTWWPCNETGFCTQPLPVDKECQRYI